MGPACPRCWWSLRRCCSKVWEVCLWGDIGKQCSKSERFLTSSFGRWREWGLKHTTLGAVSCIEELFGFSVLVSEAEGALVRVRLLVWWMRAVLYKWLKGSRKTCLLCPAWVGSASQCLPGGVQSALLTASSLLTEQASPGAASNLLLIPFFRRRRRSTCCQWITWNCEMLRRGSCPANTSLLSSTLNRGKFTLQHTKWLIHTSSFGSCPLRIIVEEIGDF